MSRWSDNYPPGVNGTEWQITGDDDDEQDVVYTVCNRVDGPTIFASQNHERAVLWAQTRANLDADEHPTFTPHYVVTPWGVGSSVRSTHVYGKVHLTRPVRQGSERG